MKKRTEEFRNWVSAYARNHNIPVERAKNGVKKEAYVLPYLKRFEKKNQHGVYFIFQSMEQGPCFHPMMPKYPTPEPDYRIIRRQRRMYTHLYFYIRDEVLGPMVMCVGTYLPFLTTYCLNGHHWIDRPVRRAPRWGLRIRVQRGGFGGASTATGGLVVRTAQTTTPPFAFLAR
ncbi:MAG: hypothetical protein IT165_03880 [Bryobacterales bacterium]|nr:hypothetical protein [Bryobacterales bacterium]